MENMEFWETLEEIDDTPHNAVMRRPDGPTWYECAAAGCSARRTEQYLTDGYCGACAYPTCGSPTCRRGKRGGRKRTTRKLLLAYGGLCRRCAIAKWDALANSPVEVSPMTDLAARQWLWARGALISGDVELARKLRARAVAFQKSGPITPIPADAESDDSGMLASTSAGKAPREKAPLSSDSAPSDGSDSNTLGSLLATGHGVRMTDAKTYVGFRKDGELRGFSEVHGVGGYGRECPMLAPSVLEWGAAMLPHEVCTDETCECQSGFSTAEPITHAQAFEGDIAPRLLRESLEPSDCDWHREAAARGLFSSQTGRNMNSSEFYLHVGFIADMKNQRWKLWECWIHRAPKAWLGRAAVAIRALYGAGIQRALAGTARFECAAWDRAYLKKDQRDSLLELIRLRLSDKLPRIVRAVPPASLMPTRPVDRRYWKILWTIGAMLGHSRPIARAVLPAMQSCSGIVYLPAARADVCISGPYGPGTPGLFLD